MDMVEYGMREREGKESFRLDHCIGQLEAQAEAEGGGIRRCLYPGLWIWRNLREGRYKSRLFPGAAQICKKKTENTLSSEKKPVCAAPMSRPEKASEKVCFCASLFRGSLTVEAAAALPLFFLALLMLIGMLNIYAVQARVSLSLDSSARKLGMYAYTAGEEKGTLTDAACQAYAAGRLKMPRGCGNLRFEGDTWDGSRIKAEDPV